jgi:dienelactone hydrolase
MLRSHWPALAGLLALAALVGAGAAEESAALQEPSIFVELQRPVGRGPFPALVLLHGCSGITSVQHDWGARLNEWGYVTLLVDSLGPRDVRNVCSTDPDGPASYEDRVQDARAALQYLRKQSFVDSERIGVIGWSMGGGVSLLSVTAGEPAPPDGPPTARFRAAVAFYPHCRPIRRYATPLMILIGAQDDWSPARRCRRLAAGRPAGPGRVQLVIYPNAYHSFDAQAPLHRYRGHLVGADPEAAADAQERVRAFLANHL